MNQRLQEIKHIKRTMLEAADADSKDDVDVMQEAMKVVSADVAVGHSGGGRRCGHCVVVVVVVVAVLVVLTVVVVMRWWWWW